MDLDVAVSVACASDRARSGARLRERLITSGSAAAWLATQPRAVVSASSWPSSSVRALAWEEPDYPLGFRALDSPPPVVFVRGRVEALPPPERCVALVGARRCTEEGRWIARDLASQLARRGVVVVSGLALGIDIAAHAGALSVGGATLAVLPSDVDHPAPRRNAGIAAEIASGGGWLLSERPPGAAIRPESFPRRNRLVAASAGAVVVVEASLRSGTLSTVQWALGLGRPVGAVPGSPLSAASVGSNRLLAAGAAVVTSAQDVMDLLGAAGSEERPVAADDVDSRAVLGAIPGASGQTAEWLSGSGLPRGRARAALLRLVAAGAVRRLDGGRIARVL
jgi:DNA processing protein